MSNLKQVKVDNWGIYFLQRLKHFFNRTDYCDLTLQFQDNAQLKVHRLVLSACTEYFELLERTCEMYEDCLVMPDDLQADVVVPIVNFMYTGQLEFKMSLLERLYQTSQIMNMPVLTKLLDAHRSSQQTINSKPPFSKYRSNEHRKPISTNSYPANKRSYSKAFGPGTISVVKEKKKFSSVSNSPTQPDEILVPKPSQEYVRRQIPRDPRPTRYELPEDLTSDSLFDSSFTNISYTSQPLMVHPETSKQYSKKNSPNAKKFLSSTIDIVECKKVPNDKLFEDSISDDVNDDAELFTSNSVNRLDTAKNSANLFDQILDKNELPKVTIEAKDQQTASNLDHAKIISEVLKKYPHLVKSNKNIKLKILNTSTSLPSKTKKQLESTKKNQEVNNVKNEPHDFTYETDVLDSKKAAELIAMGADNVKGPWICLICGTPGKALHFTSYYKFRRHLVDVHNEKPISNMCEYCGIKWTKRNSYLHHLYTKHGVPPPPKINFPKCDMCNYIALTETLLYRHKMTHNDQRMFRCDVCKSVFNTSTLLITHMHKTGHKFGTDKKSYLKCNYCSKEFTREANLYAHLKQQHKEKALLDGLIYDSEEDIECKKFSPVYDLPIKYEPAPTVESENEDGEYQIQQSADGKIELVSKKTKEPVTPKQKILNSGFAPPEPMTKSNVVRNISQSQEQSIVQNVGATSNDNSDEEIVMIDNVEYTVKNNQLIPINVKSSSDTYIVPELLPEETESINTIKPSTSLNVTQIQNVTTNAGLVQNMLVKKSNINQPIQIVVSNEEEYKALMAGQHSIIFDDNDANKTLTVLSTPNSTSLATAIDINASQASDMMIIPENYPLNVSEAVTGDNSNIVVMYSHAINNENKQYQIITSQDIGTQLIPSSAVITQNYETITTTTPVNIGQTMNTPGEIWQNNTDECLVAQEVQLSTGQLQTIAVTEEHEDISADTLGNLPEVELISNVPPGMPVEEQSKDLYTSDASNATPVIVEHTQIIPNVPTGIGSCDGIVEQEVIMKPDAESETSQDSVNNHVIEKEGNMETIEEQPSENEGNLIEQVEENMEIDSAQLNLPPTEEIVTQENVPQVQALTSEWSEDEYDIGGQEAVKTHESGVDETEVPMQMDTPTVLEESIENIQQEIENQVIETGVIQENRTNEELSDNVSPKEIDLKEYTNNESIGNNVVASEKISSLLNDWEDNDSQEEDSTVNENGEENVKEKIAEPIKDDKIKTLVSDWDEEDE